MKSLVFLTNPVDLNLAPATQYGKILTVNTNYVFSDDLWPNDEIPMAYRTRLSLAANNFRPKDDYLLLAGDHLQVVHLAALIQKHHGRFRVLRWDRIAGGYVVCWTGAPLAD